MITKKLIYILILAVVVIATLQLYVVFQQQKLQYKSELSNSNILFPIEPDGGFPPVAPTIYPDEMQYPLSPSKVAFNYHLWIISCIDNHFWHANEDSSYPDQTSDAHCNNFKSRYLSEKLNNKPPLFCGYEPFDKGLYVNNEKINGNNAIVNLHILYTGGEDISLPVNLVKEDNLWKISEVVCPKMK